MTDGAQITRINGAPGCGKTTRLLDEVAKHREGGLDAYDMFYLTFSKTSQQDVAERLVEVFPDEDEGDVGKRAKTVHGAACTAALIQGVIRDPGKQIIQPGTDAEVYRRFCASRGVSFSADETNPLALARDGSGVTNSGNQLFGVNDWLKAKRKDYSAHPQAPTQSPADCRQTTKLLRAWDAFKRDGDRNGRGKRLFEHADYVDEVIDQRITPPGTVLFIDEFQDLSPQEYLLYKTWRDSGLIDEMYIAGDPNQSVYSFRAGTPLYFEETDTDADITLKETYRCPAEIADVAHGVLDTHPDTDPQGFHAAPSADGGTADQRRIEYPEQLADQVRADVEIHASNADGNTVFLLARTNRQVGRIGNALESAGIPFELLGKADAVQPWSAPLPALYHAMKAHNEHGRDLRYAPGVVSGAMVDNHPQVDTTDDLADLAGRATAAVIDELNLYYSERERLRNAVEAPEYGEGTAYTPDVDAVKIGTIHKAKGLESPCVYLFDSYTPQLREQYHSGNGAEEHRVFYVGVTRASETLRVVGGLEGLPDERFPPFRDGLPAGREVVAE